MKLTFDRIVLILLLLAIIIYFFKGGCDSSNPNLNTQPELIDNINSGPQIDTIGDKVIATQEKMNTTLKDLKSALAEIVKDGNLKNQDLIERMKSQEQEIKKLNGVIKEFKTVVTKTTLDVSVPVEEKVDSQNNKYFTSTFIDDWANIKSEVFPNTKKAFHKISFTNDFLFTTYKVGDKSFVKVQNQNPYSETVGLNSFEIHPEEIKNPKSRFSIGIGLGLSYQNKSIKAIPNIGLNFAVFRFNKRISTRLFKRSLKIKK